MTMKRLLYIAFFSGLLLSVSTSCNDLFKEVPYDKLSENAIWGDQLILDEYVLPWYRNMDNGFSTYVTTIMKGIGREYEPWYADQMTVSRADWYNADYGDILRSSQQELTTRGRTKWSTYYTQIRSINVLLQNADQIPEGAHKQRILGEAHFFRAYYYYLLLRMYGAPIILTEPYDPLTDSRKLARATYEETVNFIVSEASQAAALLDANISESDVLRKVRPICSKQKPISGLRASNFKTGQNLISDFPMTAPTACTRLQQNRTTRSCLSTGMNWCKYRRRHKTA